MKYSAAFAWENKLLNGLQMQPVFLSLRNRVNGCGNPLSTPPSLRCGCPVDTSAEQKHRPSRQARCKRLWQSVSLLRVLRILSRFALRMTSRLVIAKPCKRLWQSVPLSFAITVYFQAKATAICDLTGSFL